MISIIDMNLLQRLIAVTLALTLAFQEEQLLAREIPERELTASQNDIDLRDALFAENLDDFGQLLRSGADPTEWLENSHNGWIFCAATDKGREPFLREIIRNGYDVDFFRSDVSTDISRPLLCAIRFDNLNALRILIDAGANPAVKICEECTSRITRSIVSEAMLVRRYDLAKWLLDKGNYSEKQLNTMVLLLEDFPVDESSPINKDRLELVEALRRMGIEVHPWTQESKDQ